MNYEQFKFKNRVCAVACAAVLVAATIALSGCSTTSALSSLIGDKPDVTAQVGAENTKQLAGVTAKSEEKTETQIDKSNVGAVDTSTRKTETIKAGTIQAQRIDVKSNDPIWIIAACAIFLWSAMAFSLYLLNRNKKAP